MYGKSTTYFLRDLAKKLVDMSGDLLRSNNGSTSAYPWLVAHSKKECW